jgi:Zn-dependent protease with chaperone function
MTQRTFTTRVLAWLLVLLIAAPELLAVATAPELPNPGSAPLSRDQQIQLGLQTEAEVYKQMPVLPDSSPVTQYVQQLGRKLVAQVPQQHTWPYHFHVIPQSDINAFALPGGPIFINLGTLKAADNEAELAGVMAHEMTHVYMQHSAKQLGKQQLTEGLAGLLGAILPGTLGGNLARLGIQLGAGAISLRYSRADEAQADAGGAIIAYKAGYNPKAMADFFQKLEKQGGTGPQFLSDHPNPGNRLQAISKEIENWPPKNFVNDSPQFASIRQAANGIKTYTAQQIADGAKQGLWAQQNAKSGAVPPKVPAGTPTSSNDPPGAAVGSADISQLTFDQVKPSSNFKQLQNNVFSMSYPDNWQQFPDQNSGGVTIAPPAGVSQGAIAYGAVIGAAQSQNGSSLDQATQSLMQSLEQSNPGMKASGVPQSVQVSGVQGRSVNLIGKSPVQQHGAQLSERDWLVTLPLRQGGLLYLVFIAPERDFNQLAPTYKKMLQSLQLK